MKNRKEYFRKYREEHKEEIKNYKKEYAKTHDSSFKKLQIKNKDLQQRIDKAIELIETQMYVRTFGEMRNLATKEDYEKLLSILKGEDEEC